MFGTILVPAPVTLGDLTAEEIGRVETMVVAAGGYMTAAAIAIVHLLGLSAEIRGAITATILAIALAALLAVRRLARYAIAIIELKLKIRLRNAGEQLGLTEADLQKLEEEINR